MNHQLWDSQKGPADHSDSFFQDSLNAIMSTSTEGIMIIDYIGTVVDVNPAFSDITGMAQTEIVGQSAFDLIRNFVPSGEQIPITAKIKKLLTGTEIPPIEVETNGKCLQFITPRNFSRSGLFVLYLHDITRRKQAEKALAASESLYRSLVENSPISIARVGIDGNFCFVNKQFLVWTGYKSEDVVGRGVEILQPFISGDQLRIMSEAVERAMREQTKTECEIEYIKPDGKSLFIAQLTYPWRAPDGGLLGVEVQGYDITRRKKAEDMLKESAAEFTRIFNLGPLVSAITTVKEGRFIEVNDAFVDITGYGRDEVIGKTALELRMVDPVVRKGAISHLINDGYSVNEADVRLKSGQIRVGIFYARPIQHQGEACQLLTVIDITDLKRSQETLQRSHNELEKRVAERTAELDKMNKELQREIEERIKAEDHRRTVEEQIQNAQRLESLGLLAGGIAHDFNNLLAGLFGNISLARFALKESGGEAAEALDRALGVFSRARDLARQLLTFAKGGHPLLKIQPVRPLLLKATAFSLSGSNSKPVFRIPDDLWPCNIDENQIGQVVDNIVINARQAMPEGGTLTIMAENFHAGQSLPAILSKGSYIKISFQDQGVGISPDLLPRIFDPFLTTRHDGSGLGLATAYSIVRKHGGCITVDSEPGKGALFHVFLPAAPGAELKVTDTINKVPSGAGARVLLMDDEESIRYVAEKILNRAAHTIMAVRNGKEAITEYGKAMNEARPYDIVILDLTIAGGMGGKEVLHLLRDLNPDLKAIASSGYSEDPIMADPGAYGFRGRIAKPFTAEMLMKTVHDVFSGQ
jgi:PAS domain S-box-containing protein